MEPMAKYYLVNEEQILTLKNIEKRLARIEELIIAQEEAKGKYPDHLSTVEACEMLRLSRKTLYKLLHITKQLPYTTVARKILIPRKEVERYLEDRMYRYKA
jgi:excisionase family DNA binding protein